jgi:hypothetical protein
MWMSVNRCLIRFYRLDTPFQSSLAANFGDARDRDLELVCNFPKRPPRLDLEDDLLHPRIRWLTAVCGFAPAFHESYFFPFFGFAEVCDFARARHFGFEQRSGSFQEHASRLELPSW